MKQAALVVIDMQKFFFVENQEVDQRELAAACGEIIEISRVAGVPVVHVATVYREDRVDWPRAWRDDEQSWCANLVRGGELTDLVDGLIVRPDDFVVEKRRFSAFYNTNLDDILRGLDCDRVYVIGYSGDVCVRFTSVDAYNRGYEVGLVYEGIESFRESKEDSIGYLAWTVGAECVSLENYRKMLAVRD
jgi:nicotinamidase-related amidase